MTVSRIVRAGILPGLNLSHVFRSRWKLRKPVCLLLPFLFAASAIAQNQNARPENTFKQAEKPAESSMKYAGAAYISGDRRDPFLLSKHYKKSLKTEDEEAPRGTPPPGIAGTLISQAKLQGISTHMDRKIAIVRGADTHAYFLKEGDKFFDGYLKAIQDDSIVLVREIKMKSGKTVIQEVTKRLRTP